jgi:hypothetical protein
MSNDDSKGALQKINTQSGISRRVGGGGLERFDGTTDYSAAERETREDKKARKKAPKEYLAIESELKSLEQQEREAIRPTTNSPAELKSTNSSQKLNVVMSVLHLTISLIGFLLLLRISVVGGLIWFLFLLVAYPVTLAFAHGAHRLQSGDLLQTYKAGVAQIPVIGKLLSQFMSAGPKKKDS